MQILTFSPIEYVFESVFSNLSSEIFVHECIFKKLFFMKAFPLQKGMNMYTKIFRKSYSDPLKHM